MKDAYTKEQRSAYNKLYREKHREHLNRMQKIYAARRKAKG